MKTIIFLSIINWCVSICWGFLGSITEEEEAIKKLSGRSPYLVYDAFYGFCNRDPNASYIEDWDTLDRNTYTPCIEITDIVRDSFGDTLERDNMKKMLVTPRAERCSIHFYMPSGTLATEDALCYKEDAIVYDVENYRRCTKRTGEQVLCNRGSKKMGLKVIGQFYMEDLKDLSDIYDVGRCTMIRPGPSGTLEKYTSTCLYNDATRTSALSKSGFLLPTLLCLLSCLLLHTNF